MFAAGMLQFGRVLEPGTPGVAAPRSTRRVRRRDPRPVESTRQLEAPPRT